MLRLSCDLGSEECEWRDNRQVVTPTNALQRRPNNTACVKPATETPDPQPAPADLAERRLRSHPYLALKNVSCGWLDGVLVLRGCLPSYYLKQLAQEAVASLKGVARIDNQIQVVTPALLSVVVAVVDRKHGH
jgi:hypothetical protein